MEIKIKNLTNEIKYKNSVISSHEFTIEALRGESKILLHKKLYRSLKVWILKTLLRFGLFWESVNDFQFGRRFRDTEN